MLRRAALALAALAFACSSNDKPDDRSGAFGAVPVTERLGGIPGLTADVNVLVDALGVPHIYAASDADAAFALGYLQARDRLLQMDLFRKAARGRLSEYNAALRDNDVFMRTVMTSRVAAPNGSHHVEDLIAARLSPEVRAFTQRYTDGVNRFLTDVRASANGATLPPAYSLLSVFAQDIAPWEVEDSIAVGRLQAFQTSESIEQELLGGQLAAFEKASPELYADLTRHAPATPSVILPSAQGTGRAPRRTALRSPRALDTSPAAAAPSIAGARAFLAGVSLPFAHGERTGSNNWTVAPSRSASGHALVANDPHLSLGHPANFHMAHVVTPSRNVAGVLFPGTPVVVIGHNERIGWGDTNVGYDVTDLYVEQLDAAQKNVTFNGQPVAIVDLPETLKVRGQAPFSFAVRLVPHHGPLLPQSVAGGSAISVRWTGQDPTFEMQAFHDLGKARSVDEAFQALTSFGVGAQNFNIADVDGNIGYDPHAVVPIRANGDLALLRTTCRPWLPMPGTGACEWTGVIADADLPQAKNPAVGYIATANNDVTGALLDDDPVGADAANANRAYLYAYTDPGYRAQRVRTRLEAQPNLDLDAMTSIQSDDHSDFADAMLAGLLPLLESKRATLTPAAQSALDRLRSWDRSTPTGLDAAGVAIPERTQNAQASTVFHAFQKRFAERVLGDELAAAGLAAKDLPNEQLFKVLVAVVSPPPAPLPPLRTGTALLCAQPGSGTCADRAAEALEDTVTFLAAKLGADPSGWLWGRAHQVRFDFLGNAQLDALTGGLFALGPFPNDGGLFTVDVANFAPFATDAAGGEQFPFLQTNGPNVRFSAEMDPAGVKWRAVIPGGQSERKGDAHEADEVPAWLANAPGDQPFAQSDVVKAAKGRIVFGR
jgi:penicillin amidase